MEVLIFKTNVRFKKHVSEVAGRLKQFPDISRWNFDLQDKDRILRIEGSAISAQSIESELQEAGYFCEELKD